MDPRSKEFIWAAKLSGEKKLVKWAGKSDGTLEQLCLKMAVLGPGAKSNERNIVEVTTFDSEQAKIKTCICALGIGKTENQTLADLALYPPAHFTLVEGSGPIHIIANHTVLDEDEFSDEDDMSDYEEEMAEMSAKKINGKGDGPKQKAKAKAPEEDEDLDDDSELDDDDLVSDDDYLDMEADDDDEEEEEEEEVQEAAPKKRKLANGKSKVETKAGSSPAKKQKKPEQQTPKAQKADAGPKTPKNEKGPKTPKSEKKTPLKPKFTSVEDVKAAIKKIPGGKPRKQDKFTNWLENQFKVNEDSWKNDLWMWHKKEQGL